MHVCILYIHLYAHAPCTYAHTCVHVRDTDCIDTCKYICVHVCVCMHMTMAVRSFVQILFYRVYFLLRQSDHSIVDFCFDIWCIQILVYIVYLLSRQSDHSIVDFCFDIWCIQILFYKSVFSLKAIWSWHCGFLFWHMVYTHEISSKFCSLELYFEQGNPTMALWISVLICGVNSWDLVLVYRQAQMSRDIERSCGFSQFCHMEGIQQHIVYSVER
jgi:hypothetical protein